jgi:hypothetical protein
MMLRVVALAIAQHDFMALLDPAQAAEEQVANLQKDTSQYIVKDIDVLHRVGNVTGGEADHSFVRDIELNST